jgi:hypothetical protein
MKVMFATPTYQGIACAPYVESLALTLELFKKNGISHAIELICGCSYVQVARNELVRKFLASDCDKLFFIDEDISWDPQGALDIVQSGQPFVGGVYPLKSGYESDAPFMVILKCDEESWIPLCSGPYLIATRTVGGFTCVDRSVFDQIKEANPQLAFDEYSADGPIPKFDFFPQGVRNHRWVGEDYAFCDLWTALGGEIAILPDITFGHHRKGRAQYGNLLRYIQQLPGGGDHGKTEVEQALWSTETDPGPDRKSAEKEEKGPCGVVDA